MGIAGTVTGGRMRTSGIGSEEPVRVELEAELKKKFGEQDDSIFLPEDKENVLELIHDLDMVDTVA